MFEIEIKAWVHNRKKVVDSLNSFAEYKRSIEKNDTYYSFPVKKDGEPVTFRIRKEKICENDVERKENLFTYKKKAIEKLPDGTSIEVNLEKEFSFSDTEPLEMLVFDLGGSLHLRKHKIVENWVYETPYGTANIELCTVPPLGDFLEIEIISESNDGELVKKIKKAEVEIMTRSGLSESDIEPRYYSDMLREKGAV